LTSRATHGNVIGFHKSYSFSRTYSRMELANRRLSSRTSTGSVVTSCSQWSQWRRSHDRYSEFKQASSCRSGDVRVIGVQKVKKQAKKKTPTDLDRALSECGPTSPDSTLFLCFLRGFREFFSVLVVLSWYEVCFRGARGCGRAAFNLARRGRCLCGQ
jgi:hypothetical protein